VLGMSGGKHRAMFGGARCNSIKITMNLMLYTIFKVTSLDDGCGH
jgi:hypothetical protein